MDRSIAVVVGNGESRKHFPVYKITGHVPLIGCNAIHRDTIVDHLVCCDERMIREAVLNPNTAETCIYVREHGYQFFRKVQKRKNIIRVPNIPNPQLIRVDNPRNWGSGTYAHLIASQLNEVKTIYMLGFDLYSPNQFVNNLYKNTKNYSNSNGHAIDPSYWIWQSAKVFKIYSHIRYCVVNRSSWSLPKEWQLDNVEKINYEDFEKYCETELFYK
jgi:hypothetical protein